jgi:hypothetical protein
MQEAILSRQQNQPGKKADDRKMNDSGLKPGTGQPIKL